MLHEPALFNDHSVQLFDLMFQVGDVCFDAFEDVYKRQVTYHWTKKRAKKTVLPSQPMIFQTLHATPNNSPLCQIKLCSQSMMAHSLNP